MSRVISCTCAFFVAGVTLSAASDDPVGPNLPWGIHIAFGDDPSTTMSVMWSTRASVGGAVVQVGASADSLNSTFTGSETEFTDVGNTQFLHRALMTNLSPGTRHYYRVGSGAASEWSAVFAFSTQTVRAGAPTDGRQSVLAVFGDLGIDVNAQKTLPKIIAEAQAGHFDAILHIGDFAYDFQSANGATGDAFMVGIEPMAATVPYHTCPGNHEDDSDFLQYRSRFAHMPRGTANTTANSTYHSFNVGLFHVVMFSSEAYFTLSPHGMLLLPDQYAWLEADLAAVDRAVTPWVVTMAHQPAYCSPNDDDDDCHSVVSLVRDGILGAFGLEALLLKYGVEIHFGAHEHALERTYPVGPSYAWDTNRTGPGAYVDFERPVHIITGAAGCPENQDGWQAKGNPFSAVRLNDYGYGRLTALNASALLWEFVDDDGGAVVDSVVLAIAAEEAAKPGALRVTGHVGKKREAYDPVAHAHELPLGAVHRLAGRA